MNFPEQLKSWLETVLSQDVPDTVAAFSFNLLVLPSREAYCLELIGAGEFDQGDSDWSRREIWAASPRYISIPNSFNCGDSFDCMHLLRQLLTNFLRDSSAAATRLKDSKAVAISFANDELETFWLAAPQNIVRNLRQPSEAHIPGDAEWAGYEDDLDTRDARKMFFGKSIEQVQRLFEQSDVLSRAEDLHFMPFAAFQYYIFAFARFVLSDRAAGNSSAADAFLRTLMERESEAPGCMSDLYVQLKPTVEFIASHQKYFDADPEIYGNFKDLAESLRTMCEYGE